MTGTKQSRGVEEQRYYNVTLERKVRETCIVRVPVNFTADMTPAGAAGVAGAKAVDITLDKLFIPGAAQPKWWPEPRSHQHSVTVVKAEMVDPTPTPDIALRMAVDRLIEELEPISHDGEVWAELPPAKRAYLRSVLQWLDENQRHMGKNTITRAKRLLTCLQDIQTPLEFLPEIPDSK